MDYMYSFLSFVLPCFVWQIINRARLQHKRYVVWHIVWAYIFILYCYLAVEVAADMGTIWDLLHNRSLMGRIYIRPFVVDEIKSHVLNVIMFMPLGFLLPYIWKNFRNIWKSVRVGFFMSLAIELSQLFCYRVTDVNDLITNTVGTVLGYTIWICANSLMYRESKHFSSKEAYVYIFGGMLGIFFMYNRALLR